MWHQRYAQARAESEEGITRHMKSFLAGGAKTGGYLGDVTEKEDDSQFSYDNLMDGTILHGSPDTVIRKIEEFRACRHNIHHAALPALLRLGENAGYAAALCEGSSATCPSHGRAKGNGGS